MVKDTESKMLDKVKISDNSWISVGMLAVFISCTVWLIGTLKDLQNSIDKVGAHLTVVDTQIIEINQNSVTKKDLQLWAYRLRDDNPDGIKKIPSVE